MARMSWLSDFPSPLRPFSRYSSWDRTDCSAAGHRLRSTSAYTRATTSHSVYGPLRQAQLELDPAAPTDAADKKDSHDIGSLTIGP